MPLTKRAKQLDIIHITHDVITTLLKFHVSYSAAVFIHDQACTQWRDLEDALHNNYPIKGVGIKATRDNLKNIDSDDDGFLYLEEPLSPEDVPNELDSFPYRAASAAYVFTLLEGYGDDLVSIINPGHLRDRQAWHHAVHGDDDLTDTSVMAKAKEGFAKPFKSTAASIPDYAVKRLVAVKAARNAFMHDGKINIEFDQFFASVVATAVFLHFITLPSEQELSIYPYCDYLEKWK